MRRTAAAILLTRGAGPGLEVFLVERAPELKFFGGYLALPGGVLAVEDGLPADEAAALQACALRELFEEVGLVRHHLRGMAGSPQELRVLRQAMVQKDAGAEGVRAWRQAIASAKTPPPLPELCRIETPPFAPVRYDTVFFHAALERCRGSTLNMTPDVWPGELTGGRFWRATDALAAWREGSVLLVPPVVILLELLAANADFDAFARSAKALAGDYRQGRLHQVRFSPGVVLAPLRSPTLPPATTTNCYVVGRDELWVIDPGSPDRSEQQRLVALLRELCTGSARISGILLTHHHGDHTGGVAELSRELDLAVRGHPLTLERTPGDFRRGAPLLDGDRVALGTAPDGRPGWEVVAIHTPGHDRGHLCFRETRYDAVIVGDMLSTVSTIVIDPPEGHLATYLQSLERLLREPMTTLYPAHGPAMRNGHKLIQKYLRHRTQRETTLVETLRQGSGTVADLVTKVYWDTDASMHRIAARSLLAGLQKLQEEGRAAEQGGVWRLT